MKKIVLRVSQSLLAILSIVFLISCNASENRQKPKEIIYILQGHWGNFLEPSQREGLKQAGYELEPMYMLNERANAAGYELRIANRDTSSLQDVAGRPTEEFKYLIVFDVFPHQQEYLKHYPKEKLILFIWEPPSVSEVNYDPKYHEIFSKVYTWKDDLVDNVKYFKSCYPVMRPMTEQTVPFDQRNLACQVSTNRHSSHPNELYSERVKVMNFYQRRHRKDFDQYGRWWSKSYSTYKGPLENKLETLKQYKFNYCYENIKGVPGYITEKIFDCFEAGIVPIYWGASNIRDYIPEGCFIDREQFKSNEELYLFLKNMDEDTYQKYIEQIRLYLTGDKAKLFSYDRFVSMMMEIID